MANPPRPHLSEQVAPKEGRLHQANGGAGPLELLRDGQDGDAHVHAVHVAQLRAGGRGGVPGGRGRLRGGGVTQAAAASFLGNPHNLTVLCSCKPGLVPSSSASLTMKATKHMATMPQRRCQPSWRAAARALLPLPLPSAPLNSPLPTTSP